MHLAPSAVRVATSVARALTRLPRTARAEDIGAGCSSVEPLYT